MISMVSTIANGGNRMKLRLVKKIIDSQTGEEKEIEPQSTGQVISKETANNVLSMNRKKCTSSGISSWWKNRNIRRWS